MSHYLQIQNALSQIEGGKFQTIVNKIIYNEGYSGINEYGSVTGTDKTKIGTPDTFVLQLDGKFIFVEITSETDKTVKKTGILKKIKSDIAKDLDSGKTGIPHDKISKIIYFYLEKLSPAQVNEIQELTTEQSVPLDLWSGERIAHTLDAEYPAIALEELGIAVDSGQFLLPHDFIVQYNKDKLAAPVDTILLGREKELVNGIELLEKSRILTITGDAGAGKTRFALALQAEYKRIHSETAVYCIRDKSINITDDLQKYVEAWNNLLIFIDDANRYSDLRQFVEFAQNSPKGKKIKLLLTVRKYAESDVKNICSKVKEYATLKINNLDHETFKKLITENFDITNPLYIERIEKISNRNARLCVLCCRVAKEEKRFDSISNIARLYDALFSNVLNDIGKQEDKLFLRTAAILSAYQTIDIENNEQWTEINQLINIEKQQFKDFLIDLFHRELADKYGNSVFKITDQTLATYLVYIVFFKEEYISFKQLFSLFFPSHIQLLTEIINPVCQCFDFNKTKQIISPVIADKFTELKQNNNEKDIIRLAKPYHIFIEEEILEYMTDKIAEMPLKNEEDNMEKYDELSERPAFFSILVECNSSNILNAVKQLLILVERTPYFDSKIQKLFSEGRFSLSEYSEPTGFSREQLIETVFWTYYVDKKTQQATDFYYALAKSWLGTFFTSASDISRNEISFYRFGMSFCEKTCTFRHIIWTHLAELAENEQKSFFFFLKQYETAVHQSVSQELIADDLSQVIPILQNIPEKQQLFYYLILDNLNEALEVQKLKLPEDLLEQYMDGYTEIYKILRPVKGQSREIGIVTAMYQNPDVCTYFKNANADKYILFLKQAEFVQKTLTELDRRNEIQDGINSVFYDLSTKPASIIYEVIDKYLDTDDCLHLDGIVLSFIIPRIQPTILYEILRKHIFPGIETWQLSFFIYIQKEDIRKEYTEEILTLLKSRVYPNIWNFNFLLAYEQFDSVFIVKALQNMFTSYLKEKKDCSMLINFIMHSQDIDKNLSKFIQQNPQLFFAVYLELKMSHYDDYFDYNKQILNMLIDQDKQFIKMYMNRISENKQYVHPVSCPFTCIWDRADYNGLVDMACDFYFSELGINNQENYYHREFLMELFSPAQDETVKSKQNRKQYVLSFIEKYTSSSVRMTFIGKIIADNFYSDQYEYVQNFLAENKNPADFENFINAVAMPESFTFDSLSNTYKNFKESLQKLLPLCNTTDLYRQKLYITRRIDALQKQIRKEERNEFSGGGIYS